jgi:hypothetical protein
MDNIVYTAVISTTAFILFYSVKDVVACWRKELK